MQYASVAQFNKYPFVARPWKITGRQVNFDGGDLKVRIYSAGAGSETQGTATNVDRQLVQSMEIKFPSFTAPSPILADDPVTLETEIEAMDSTEATQPVVNAEALNELERQFVVDPLRHRGTSKPAFNVTPTRPNAVPLKTSSK